MIREKDNRDFLCLDWDEVEPYIIYGGMEDLNRSTLDVVLAPCNYIHYDGDTIDPICEYDQ